MRVFLLKQKARKCTHIDTMVNVCKDLYKIFWPKITFLKIKYIFVRVCVHVVYIPGKQTLVKLNFKDVIFEIVME